MDTPTPWFVQQSLIQLYTDLMIEWNRPFKIGLTGLIGAILFFAWLIYRAMVIQDVHVSWVLGLLLIIVISLATCVASQITKISIGGG